MGGMKEMLASAGLAEGDPASSATASAQGSQGFIVAVPQGTDPAAASRFAAEPQQLPPTEVTAPRDDRGPCDPRAGTGQEACRAKLAAKYAEMDKLCRIVRVHQKRLRRRLIPTLSEMFQRRASRGLRSRVHANISVALRNRA